ncbi:MAG: hypothetical protein R6V07_04570 [Armatimonadota bacterium]
MSNFTYRELYCPAHFGNTHEVMSAAEIREMCREARHFGYTVYGDWFDSADLKNPLDNPRNEHLLPQELWERKLRNFRIAQEEGLGTNLMLTSNHVYLNQLRDDLLAETSGDHRMFGQLLCPSIPEAREIILRNARELFALLAASGVTVDNLHGFAYDYGGCSCEKCSPWIVTMAELFLEELEIAREYFGDVTPRLIGWWVTEEEHELLADWADENARGVFASCALHIQYGEKRPAGRPRLPEGCEPHAFVHIGYNSTPTSPKDVYGIYGPVVAPERLEATERNLRELGCTGYVAYDEGAFDDCNRAIWGALTAGHADSAEEVLTEYAARHLSAGEDAPAWAAWLAQWGEPLEVDAPAARAEFTRLVDRLRRPFIVHSDRRLAPSLNWRLAQWECKIRLFELDAKLREVERWSDEALALADEFVDEREWMQRNCWGIGPLRHAIHPHFQQPTWWHDYLDAGGGAARLSDLSTLGEEA